MGFLSKLKESAKAGIKDYREYQRPENRLKRLQQEVKIRKQEASLYKAENEIRELREKRSQKLSGFGFPQQQQQPLVFGWNMPQAQIMPKPKKKKQQKQIVIRLD